MVPRNLDIIIWPDPRLETKCKDVTQFDGKGHRYLNRLIPDMVHTMVNNDGVGLAAPQVGILENIIVIAKPPIPLVFINPEIVSKSDKLFKCNEGCLSIPGFYAVNRRPKEIVVKYQDISGNKLERKFNDLWAFVIHHEIDHLFGICFIDKIVKK
jgi:peptide deformylase